MDEAVLRHSMHRKRLKPDESGGIGVRKLPLSRFHAEDILADESGEGALDGSELGKDTTEFTMIPDADVGGANDLALADFVPHMIEDDRPSTDAKLGKKLAREVVDEETAERFMEWLIAPVSLETFYDDFWERRPLVIRRSFNRSYYAGWLGKADVEAILRDHNLLYGRHVDVTKYADGERSTLNGEGALKAEDVWQKYEEGCSVRLLHPQRWSDPLWLMLSALELHWNAVAGCNAYLTPAGCQGFSPHYDDIDAFILQTEGSKQWRCYAPRSLDETLPRFPSPNFQQEEIGEAVLDVELHPGDLLYMPRGTIHQAVSPPGGHSLHVTLSTGQRNTWADFLEAALPRALQLAAEESVELRQGLPRDMFSFMGVVNSDRPDERREAFQEHIMDCLNLLFQSGPWDSAADQMAVRFFRARLPPSSAARRPLEGDGQGTLRSQKLAKLKFRSRVRLSMPGVARLVVEGDCAVLYHYLHNSRSWHNEGDECIEGSRTDDGVGAEGARRGRGGEGPLVDRLPPSSSSTFSNGKQHLSDEALALEDQEGEGVTCSGTEFPVGPVSEEDADCERGRLEFPLEYAEVIEQILDAFPEPLPVSEFALDSKESCLHLAQQLLEEGILNLVV